MKKNVTKILTTLVKTTKELLKNNKIIHGY
jgi:hypothetical protein